LRRWGVLSSGNLYNKYAMQPLLRWGRHCAGIEGRSSAGAMKISRFFLPCLEKSLSSICAETCLFLIQ
jgi:hypothetical protein